MEKNENGVNALEWICSDCAAKSGWKLPNGHVVSSILDKCPHCGRRLWLVNVSDYMTYGRRQNPKNGMLST